MKALKICWSLLLVSVVTFTVIVPLLQASACAEDPMASRSSVAGGVPSGNPVSKWVGAYNPFSHACMPDMLTMFGSTFSWADCKVVRIRVITVSDTELVFEVDPKAKCGLAGWIVALTTPSADSRAVDVTAYQSLMQYETKGYDSFCAYVKRTTN